MKELFCTLLRDNKILVERTISYQEAGILQQIRKSGELLEEEYRPEGILSAPMSRRKSMAVYRGFVFTKIFAYGTLI